MDGQVILDEKERLLQELLLRLEQEYRTLQAAQRATQAAATHEEAKPENDKDTRAVEQSYLARGQAERVQQLERDVLQLRGLRLRRFTPETPIALGALVELSEVTGEKQLVFLVPAGAGEALTSSLGAIRTVTPQSPLGAVLLGSFQGDEVELDGPQGRRTVELTEVH